MIGSGLVLMTRPLADDGATADALRRAGFAVMEAPVLEIVDTDAPLPDPAPYDGLIFSSANGVRSLSRRSPQPDWFSKTAYAVGEGTAEAARAAGFIDVRAGTGRMIDLTARIAGDFDAPGRLLHISGADIRSNPAMMLPADQGWRVDRVVLYRAVMLDGLTLPVLEALEARTVAAVLLYSARSAQAFLKAVENSGLRADFSGVHALCIADSVLESVQGVDWAGIHVAPTPDQSGMLALIESMKNPA